MSVAPAATATPTPVIEVRHLTTVYRAAGGTRVTRAVDDVSFTLQDGETLGVVGESGSGKTTLAMSLVRLLGPGARVESGEILFEGHDLAQLPERDMRRIRGRRIGMILQDPMASLNPLFSIGDQVGEPLRIHAGASRRTARERALALLRGVRIAAPESRMREYPHQMSGGMRQRIVGAIALSCRPRLLIADEPTTSLDVTIQRQYLALLRDLQRERGLAMLFITHDLGIVAKMCDRVAVMYAGRIVELGSVRAIFETPAHPYTRALLDSMPRLGDPRTRLTAIDGQPPDLSALPAGCAFAARCAKVEDRCRAAAPPEREIGERHSTRCWLWEGHSHFEEDR